MPVAETLLIAAAGGITFTLIGVPAGLVSGSVLAVATAALAHAGERIGSSPESAECRRPPLSCRS